MVIMKRDPLRCFKNWGYNIYWQTCLAIGEYLAAPVGRYQPGAGSIPVATPEGKTWLIVEVMRILRVWGLTRIMLLLAR